MSNMQLPHQSSISMLFSRLHKLNIIMQDKQNSKDTTIRPWHVFHDKTSSDSGHEQQ